MPLLDHAHPDLPLEVLTRLETAEAFAETRLERINTRLSPYAAQFSHELQRITASREPVRARLHALRALAARLSDTIGVETACRKGCAHCCHIPVALTQTEANLVGAAIGQKPRQVRNPVPPSQTGHGYHLPCPFLKRQGCSIYEHRPFACRTHFNLDQDDLLCQLIPDKQVPLPLMDLTPLQMAYIVIGDGEALADIREYFPPAKQG